MTRKILLVCMVFSLALAGCAPAALAQQPVKAPDRPGTLEASLPVSEWDPESREFRLYPLDPERGQALPGYAPISLGNASHRATSPDRSMLAAVSPSRGLVVVDLATWKEQVYELPKGVGDHAAGLVFDPEGRRLALIYGHPEGAVAVFDLDQAAVTAQSSPGFQASQIKFTADSRGLMVYGPHRVALLDSDDLSLQWAAELEDVRDGIYSDNETAGEAVDFSQPDEAVYFFPGLAFAPDQDVLYIVHPDEDRLTRVSFAEQEVVTVAIETRLSWFERLLSLGAGVARAKVAQGTHKRAVVSPDGQSLYVIGQDKQIVQDENGHWETVPTWLGLQMIRIADGARLAIYEQQVDEMSISPDGRFLYLGNWGVVEGQTWTEVFDTIRWEAVGRLEGVMKPVLRVNGGVVLTSSDWVEGTGSRTRVVDAESLEVLAEWLGPEYLDFTSWGVGP